MMKLMSTVLSVQMGSAATVTDSTGNVVEIEDELLSVYTMPSTSTEFEKQWFTTDDRVMGGQSYSYVEYESGYGKFYGTASSVGGGFSNVGTTDYSQDDWQEFNGMSVLVDMSGYDGLVIDVASQDARTLQFDLADNTWRWPQSSWQSIFEVPGGMQQTTIYIPFSSFNPSIIGFSMWWYKYSLFQSLDVSEVVSMAYSYSLFRRISYFFLMTVPVDNYEEGAFEFHFKDIKAFKLKNKSFLPASSWWWALN